MTPFETEKPFLSRSILHPFAFALFPILWLYSCNLGQTYPRMVLSTLILVFAVTAVCFFSLRRLLRKPDLAALITSLFVLYFFLYGEFTMMILKVKFGNFIFLRNIHRIPLYTAIFLVVGFGIFKLYRRWSGLTKLLNVISLCLCLLSSLTLVGKLLFGSNGYSPVLSRTPKASLTAPANDSLPDIYYIILDGYGSEEVLNKYFGYDNTQFVTYLKDKGFFLPAKARSNYGMTALSLASSLNMEYLKVATLETTENKARSLAETNGYEYIGFSSMNPPPISGIKRGGFAWRKFFQNEFTLQLLRTTVADPVALRVNFYAYTVRDNFLTCLDLLQQLPETPGKKLVFAHLLCPHPPYVFKSDGGSPSMSFSEANLNVYRTPWDDKDGYVQQVQFLNTKVMETIDHLLKKSKVPPVIILQGDHGPKLTVPQAMAIDMNMHILNAYYLPGGRSSALTDDITPVNTFRVIFNQYLHTGLPLLENKCYYSNFETPFVLSDVTAQLDK